MIYSVISPQSRRIYILFQVHMEYFIERPHIKPQKSFSKFKKIQVMLIIFSVQTGLKLQINNKKKTEEHTKTWRLNKMVLNNEWINNENKEEIKKHLETSENVNTAMQSICSIAKAVPRGIFIALKAYLKKQEKSQINSLTLHLKSLEKEQAMFKVSRRKETIKVRVDINEIESKK